MAQGLAQAARAPNERSAKILARSFYRQLRDNGYTPSQVVAMASELISLVTDDIRQRPTVVSDASAT